MANDFYGNEITVGSVVTVVGSSGEYTVSDLHYDGEMADIVANEAISIDQDGVHTNQLIKVG